MPKLSFKEIAIPTIALTLICGISSALLACTNEITHLRIAAAEEETKQNSMRCVTPENTVTFEKAEITDNTAECYKALDKDGNIIAYAISASVKGYGGTIKVMTGIDNDGNLIAVNVYDNSSETPGLGAKTSESEFTDGFKTQYPKNGFAVSKDAEKYPSAVTVDAVTGATISSRAAVSAVNIALDIFDEVSGGIKK
ncbi:MAG: RnfABCDGE type electron transport complex subunit G [Acutalibacteraceae bacterium]|nr:RnfABCDGE type electron transport complex subunit G [Clostridia bacterium]MEE3449967.1 RnfABCDGE type electron transport complex subunit G [Acutalibacteraceae bacterium]